MLLVESVGYNPRAANVVDVLYTIGNCLPAATGGHVVDHLRRVENVLDLVDPDTNAYVGATPVVVRGQIVAVDAPVGERFEDLFRRLVPEHQELLLASEQELRAWLPADVPQVLRLDQWHHVDVTVRPSSPERERARERHRMLSRHAMNPVPFEIRPSDTETYRHLAAVLATGDASHYRPTLPPNIHWPNWPESGSL